MACSALHFYHFGKEKRECTECVIWRAYSYSSRLQMFIQLIILNLEIDET